jgi:hypothetical protein
LLDKYMYRYLDLTYKKHRTTIKKYEQPKESVKRMIKEFKEHLAAENPDAVLLDGLDTAIAGTMIKDGNRVVVYDQERIIKVLMERDGMSHEDALDFYGFNIEGAYMGPHTPVFIEPRGEWDDAGMASDGNRMVLDKRDFE